MNITIKNSLLVCFSIFLFSVSNAQQFLEIDISNRCIYSGTHMDEELYAFSTDVNTMDNIINEVLELGGGLKQNFVVHQTNVENVSAVVDDGKRYLLWSQDFLEKANDIEAFGTVAHEIGHHISKHTLRQELTTKEEQEADFFMGFVFYKKNFTLQAIRNFIAEMPKAEGEGLNEVRLETVMAGYKKAERYLSFKSIPFDNDPSLANFLQAQFPFPPPECHTSYEIPLSTFNYRRTLGEVSEKITGTLDQKKYPYRYLSVPEGFAIVTQMEQYNRDGSILKNSAYRWVDHPVKESFGFSWDYIKSLVYPRKGYLRLFVFIITRQNYSSDKRRISKSEAAAWLSQGVNRLPRSIAEEPFNNDYAVSLLVYEFEVPESNHRPQQSCPCQYQALEHLERSGLKNGLQR